MILPVEACWRPFTFLLAWTMALCCMAQGGFVTNGRLKVEGGGLDGSKMVIYHDGKKERTVNSGLKKFSLHLELNTSYVLSFEKEGFVTKKLSFDTHAPAAAAKRGFTPFEFVVSLFKQYDGVNTVVFNQPVGMIRFNPTLADFDYDTDYTKSIQSALAKAQDEVKQKQAEEKKQAEQDAQAAKRKAKVEAKAVKKKPEPVRKEAKPVEAHVPATPAPKPPKPRKARPAPARSARMNALKATANKGLDVRMATSPKSGFEASPVRPAQAHAGSDPKQVPQVAATTTVRHEQLIVNPNQVVKVVLVEEGDKKTEYRKVVRKYSGTYYFKDGQSCSKFIFNKEALADVGR